MGSFENRRLGRRRLLGVGAGGAAAAFLAACGGDNDNDSSSSSGSSGASQGLAVATSTRAAETGQPKPGGYVSWTFAANAPLDPFTNATYSTQLLASFMMSRLMQIKTGADPAVANNYELEPDLAESVEFGGDGLSVTVKLKPNAKFFNIAPVNGRVVDSEDVKFSTDRFRSEPRNNNRGVFGGADNPLLDRVETPDPRTAVFKLLKPYGPFTSLIADSNYLWIMPKELGTGGYDSLKTVIGTGPFMIESIEPDIVYKVKKNPDYHVAGRPYIDGVNLTRINETAQSIAQFQAGRLESAGIPFEQIEDIKRTVPKATYLEYIPTTLYYIAMQQRGDSPFKDVRVRRALSMSIDRDALLDLTYNGRGAWNSALPGSWGSWRVDPKGTDMGQAAQWYKYNPAESKKLLAAAGYPNGLPMKFNYSNNIYGDTFNQNAEAVAGMLNQGGFQVTINPQDYLSVYIVPVTGTIFGNYDGIVFGNTAQYADPHLYFTGQYHSASTRNTSGVKDPQLDALIAKEEATLNTDERKKLVKEIQIYIGDQQHYSHTTVGPAYIGVQPWLKNYQRNNGYGYGAEVYSKVWIDRT